MSLLVILLSVYREVELARSHFLIFWGIAVLFYIPTSNAWGSKFAAFPPTLTFLVCSWFVLCFDNRHPKGCEVVYLTEVCGASHVLVICVSSLEK